MTMLPRVNEAWVVMFNHEPVAVSFWGEEHATNLLSELKELRYSAYLNAAAEPLTRERWEHQYRSSIVAVPA